MIKGRLGLEKAHVPHSDRHGLLWLSRGNLTVEAGTLRFMAAGGDELEPGAYSIPYQGVSVILLGPGVSITHDVLRLCGAHSVGLMAVGDWGVRLYSMAPKGPDRSALARRQALLWADPDSRLHVARAMYTIRLGDALPMRDISALRGIEGARMRETYKLLAKQYHIPWQGRKYDRQDPESTDCVNMALNHAAVAVRAAAEVAVAATATIPQLGFIHEDSSLSFALDIADLFRENFTLPAAFSGYQNFTKDESIPLERVVRRLVGRRLKQQKIISRMIDRIKELLDANDSSGYPERY